ncbi:integral membrane protein [Fusarium oxysporum f. sp. phaseoli]
MAIDATATSVEPTSLGRTLLAVDIFFLIPISIILILRYYARLKHQLFDVDDGLMLIGWMLYVAVSGIVARSVFAGLGTKDENLNTYLQNDGRKLHLRHPSPHRRDQNTPYYHLVHPHICHIIYKRRYYRAVPHLPANFYRLGPYRNMCINTSLYALQIQHEVSDKDWRIGIVSTSLPTLHKLASSRFHFDSTEMSKRRKRKGDAKITPGSTGNATAGKIADTIGSIHVVQ